MILNDFAEFIANEVINSTKEVWEEMDDKERAFFGSPSTTIEAIIDTINFYTDEEFLAKVKDLVEKAGIKIME